MIVNSAEPLLGRLAVEMGILTMEKLVALTREQGRRADPPPLGALMVEMGLASQADVDRLLVAQRELNAKRAAGGSSPAMRPVGAPLSTPGAPRAPSTTVKFPGAPPPSTPTARAGGAAQTLPPGGTQAPAAMRAPPVSMAAKPGAPLAPSTPPAAKGPPAPTLPPVAGKPAAAPVPQNTGAFKLGGTPPAAAPPAKPAAPAMMVGNTILQPVSNTGKGGVQLFATPMTLELEAVDDLPLPELIPDLPLEPLDDIPLPELEPEPPASLAKLLADIATTTASDLHIHAGSRVRVRSLGKLSETGVVLTADMSDALVREVMTAEQQTILDRKGEVDFAYTAPGGARFRANAYRQQRGTDAVFRSIPAEPPSLADLGLPTTLARLTTYHQGLVLVTGPAGCGKTSTLAALVNLINEERQDHILTIEDPIEVVHPSKRCVVNQRQVKRHTESFARALRGALREDPDVIVIGEMRDHETISLALSAAETGHLVLATLHTNSAIRTINRMVGVFPPTQQPQIRSMISESLRAVVSQRLVVTADNERRVPALEILYVNHAVGNLIRENRTLQIRSILQTGQLSGMCLMEQSLQELVKSGVVTQQEAARHLEAPPQKQKS